MKTFLPLQDTWLSRLLVLSFLLVWLAASISFAQHIKNYWVVLGCFGPAIQFILYGLYQLRQRRYYQISLDPQSITFVFLSQLGKAQKPITVQWPDIVQASWHPTAEMLTLITEKDVYLIPLKDFVGLDIWQEIKQFVTPTALDKHQNKTLPPVEYQTILDPNTTPLHLSSSRGVKLVWSLAFLGSLGVFYYLSVRGLAWGIFCLSPLFLVVLGLIERDFKQIEISHDGIQTTLGFFQKFIAWSEITSIWWNLDGRHMEILGKQRRMIIPGPTHWSPPAGQQFMAWLSAKTWQLNIPFGQKLPVLVKLPVATYEHLSPNQEVDHAYS